MTFDPGPTPKAGTVTINGCDVPCILGTPLPEKLCADRLGKLIKGHYLNQVKFTDDYVSVDTTVTPHTTSRQHFRGQVWEICPNCAGFKPSP